MITPNHYYKEKNWHVLKIQSSCYNGHVKCIGRWINGQECIIGRWGVHREEVKRTEEIVDPLVNSPLREWKELTHHFYSPSPLYKIGWNPKLHLTNFNNHPHHLQYFEPIVIANSISLHSIEGKKKVKAKTKLKAKWTQHIEWFAKTTCSTLCRQWAFRFPSFLSSLTFSISSSRPSANPVPSPKFWYYY